MREKYRILVLADSPTCATGFAQVSRNVLRELFDSGKFEIDMIGINYLGEYDRDEFRDDYYFISRMIPAKHPGSNDVYGREYALQVLRGAVKNMRPPWHALFTIQDPFILEARSAMSGYRFSEAVNEMQRNTLMDEEFKENYFTWIGYYPIDSPLKKTWYENAIKKTNWPVAYCDYGQEQINKMGGHDNLKVIRHGTNTSDFYPLSPAKRKKARQETFKDLVKDDTFLLVNVNRNQIRKDMLRTMLIYKKFRERVKNSFLYFHCNANDVGGNLYDIARSIGLDTNSFGVPANFNENFGVPIKKLNEIYNAADGLITTTLGEGWGLTITEAMATKTPVFAPRNTSIPELLDNGKRGFIFECGMNDSQKVCFGPVDNEQVRPISNVDSAVEQLVYAYQHPEEVKKRVERAYKWATELTWAKESKKWIELFEYACEGAEKLRKTGMSRGILKDDDGNTLIANGKEKRKLGRNDICWCGSGKKYKKCHLGKD